MFSIESVLPIFQGLNGSTLSPIAFASVCAESGWPEPVDDGIGLWEVEHPSEGTPLILDTVTEPTTLICRLDGHDDYEPPALVHGALRDRFDLNFNRSVELLSLSFPVTVQGTYEPPHNWRYAHFQGLNSLIALEQTHYDPIMGVQLLLLLQPMPTTQTRSPVTSAW